ncbi:MAG: hypothetical protein AAGH90_10835 [Pseudomonadota bacterium]
MTEAQLTSQMVDVMTLFLGVASVMMTIISAYVVALFVFLRGAGLLMRFWAFGFLTFGLILLGVFTYGVNRHALGIREGLFELDAQGALSALGTKALEQQAGWVGTISISVFAFLGVALYLSLAYLSFLHDWNPKPAMAQSGGSPDAN